MVPRDRGGARDRGEFVVFTSLDSGPVERGTREKVCN